MWQITSKANLLACLSPASNFSHSQPSWRPLHIYSDPPPIHFNPQTFKVRQTGPFVSSPGGPGLLEAPGSILSLGSGIFPKFWTVACNSSLREKPVPWGRVGKGSKEGWARGQRPCGRLTEPEEPGNAPQSPGQLASPAHSGTAASLPGTALGEFPHKRPT